jgi:hypothetical protein
MMLPARRHRIVFRPVRWVIYLLMAVVLWIGFLRLSLIVPTPADVDDGHSYFSPLPAPAFAYFFRLNAPLLGWHPWFPPEKYKMTFASGGNSSVPEGVVCNSPACTWISHRGLCGVVSFTGRSVTLGSVGSLNDRSLRPPVLSRRGRPLHPYHP